MCVANNVRLRALYKCLPIAVNEWTQLIEQHFSSHDSCLGLANAGCDGNVPQLILFIATINEGMKVDIKNYLWFFYCNCMIYRLSLVPLVISRCHSITELQFGLEMLPEVWMLFPAYLYGINTVIGNISRIVTDKKIRPRPIHSIEVITNNLWNFQANRSSRLRAIGEQTDY